MVDTSRRNFLKGLGAAAAVAAIGIPAGVKASAFDPYARVHRALTFYRETLKANDAYRVCRELGTKEETTAAVELLRFRAGLMMNFFNTDFPAPFKGPNGERDGAEQAETRRIFNERGWSSSVLWDVPPKMLEVVLPIAIMRDLIATRKAPLDARHLMQIHGKTVQPFKLFADRYKDLVMS